MLNALTYDPSVLVKGDFLEGKKEDKDHYGTFLKQNAKVLKSPQIFMSVMLRHLTSVYFIRITVTTHTKYCRVTTQIKMKHGFENILDTKI